MVDEVLSPPGHDTTVSLRTSAPVSFKRLLGAAARNEVGQGIAVWDSEARAEGIQRCLRKQVRASVDAGDAPAQSRAEEDDGVNDLAQRRRQVHLSAGSTPTYDTVACILNKNLCRIIGGGERRDGVGRDYRNLIGGCRLKAEQRSKVPIAGGEGTPCGVARNKLTDEGNGITVPSECVLRAVGKRHTCTGDLTRGLTAPSQGEACNEELTLECGNDTIPSCRGVRLTDRA